MGNFIFEINRFSANKLIADVGEEISFNWGVSGLKKEGMIIFGDGNSQELSSMDSQTTHSYSNQGKYSVKLILFNHFGTADERALKITIKNNAPSFSLDVPGIVYEDDPVIITLSSISDSAFDINFKKLTILYDFSDGEQVRIKNSSIIHKWTNQGTYQLRVTIMDDQGALTHKSRTIQVLNVNPVANFEVESTFFPLNSQIEFNGSITYDSESDKNSLTYIWDFDDGIISIGEYVIHQYTNSGDYSVSLTVRDDDDSTDIYTKNITIENGSPFINFSVPTQNIRVSEGETYIFNALVLDDDAQGVNLHYWWNFNSTEFNPLDLSNYELGGWINSHLFQDDYIGQMTVATIDAVGNNATTQADFQVENVAPSINIWDASVVANITFGFYQNGLNDNNFSYILIGDHNVTMGNFFNLSGMTGNTLTFHHKNVPMSLAKDWVFAVNSSSHVNGTSSPSFGYNVTFDFLDGQKLFYSSGNLSLGDYGYWWINLPSWYDSGNYTFNKPITFNLDIFDPSIDTVNFTAIYSTITLLNISSLNFTEQISTFSVASINYTIELFLDNGSQCANITSTQLVQSKVYDENLFPLNVQSNFTIYPFMNIHNLLENMGLTNLTILDCQQAISNIFTKAVDDDFGESILNIQFNTTSTIEFGYLSPQITFMTQKGGSIGSILDFYARISMFNVSYYNWSSWNNVNCYFGYENNYQVLNYFVNYSSDNYGLYVGNFSFDHQGYYLITLNTTDPFGYQYSTGTVIFITSPSPLIYINQFANTSYEDNLVDFSFSSNLYNDNPEDYRFMWDFGDGTYSYEKNPSHFWDTNGSYEISLTMYDKYGNYYQDRRNITIIDHLPEILGPYIFQGIESRNIILDIDLTDSIKDELGLQYYWYDETSTLFSVERKPVVNLQDGIYNYTLIVKDSSGYESSANLTLNVFSITPEVYSADYSYSGKPSATGEGFIWGVPEEDGMVELSAFAFDTDEDTSTLTYFWKITRENVSFTYEDSFIDRENSTVYFRVNTTTFYFGEILVVDSSGKEKQISFTINSFIDSNGNGYSDEFEHRLALTGETIKTFRDSDGDGFSDKYERDYTFTNASIYDSDGDGLSDGNLGESNFGTDPLTNDTDQDGLLDGIEIFGWNITINYFGTSANFSVNSNPLVNDTDLDGLLDYSEYLSGSDPHNPDTDNDGLTDEIDPFPASYDNDGDGLSDLEELNHGTRQDQADTDGDSINDGDELYGWGFGFKTNPLSQDTDHDFLADNAEMKTYNNKINNRVNLDTSIYLSFNKDIRKAIGAQISLTISFGEAIPSYYGIMDVPDIKVSVFKFDDQLLLYNGTTNHSRYFSHVIDFKDTIENNNFNYKGVYVIKINNTEAGCLLEQFEIQVARYLDPNDFDTDNDLIMDGVENALLVLGTDTIDFNDIYENNLTVDNDPNTYNEFVLTIPQVGRVTDANLSLAIDSEDIPTGSGNVSISLIKDELNESYVDPVLINYNGTYSNSNSFSFTSNLDLSQYIANKTIKEYYGDYRLSIIIQNSTLHDNFTLSSFSINTNTYVEASASDSQAWITDPGSWDTDGDLWADSYEIYLRAEPTNPLSVDTDGDGAWDSVDRDPLRDVMLEIVPDYAQNSNMLYWERSAVLEIVIAVEIGNQKYCFMTPETRATEARQHTFIWPFWHYYHYMRTRYNDIHYYLNINDWVLNPITFHFELWHIGHDMGQWDTYILGGNKDCYASDPYGPSQVLYVSGKGVFGYTNKLSVNVNTVALEKTNTIAIYENTTVFNGHYQSKEKMDIIQLEVNETSGGTPFVKGVNTIVIPNALFTKTLLNAQIQNKELDPLLFPEDENICKFISIERDGTTEEACDEIDFVIIRYQISQANAMLILDLLLTCLVNTTTNKAAVSYLYYSTKENDTNAVMMNLFKEVLGFVLWNSSDYINSRQGAKPTDLGEWIVNIVEDVVNFVVGIFIAIGQFFINLWNVIVGFVSDVLMAVIPFLADFLWLLVRAAILIAAYIVFALEFVVFFITFQILIVSSIVMCLALSDCFVEVEINKIVIYKNTGYILMKYEVGLDYIEFFDVEIPTLYVIYERDTNVVRTKSNLFNLGILSLPDLSTLMESSGNSSLELSYEHLKTSSSEDNIARFLAGFIFAFDAVGLAADMLGLSNLGTEDPFIKQMISVISTAALIASFIAIIKTIRLSEQEVSKDELKLSLSGFAVGIVLALLLTRIIAKSVSNKDHIKILQFAEFGLIAFSLFKIILEDFEMDPDDLLNKFWIELRFAMLGLVIGAVLIGLDENPEDELKTFTKVGRFFFIVSLLMVFS